MTEWQEQRPSEDFYRVLSPDGTLEKSPPDLDENELLRMYRAFVQTRVYEEKLLRMQRRGEVSIISRSLGEEATPVGSMAALEPDDWCYLSYRQAAGLFYWGFPMEQSIAGLMSFEPETLEEHLPVDEEVEPPINFSPVYVPLATNIPNAAGSAMVDEFTDTDVVNMAYIGDGATSQGGFYEGLNFAGVFDAPLVTICQNNQWAISVPAHRQTAAKTFAQKAEAVGIPHERVDGNDIFAVYEKTKEAVDHARASGGPSVIECVTYRMVEHNTADEESVYRNDTEREYWEEHDPVDRFETYLRSEGILHEDKIEAIQNEMEECLQNAVNEVRDLSTSDPERMFDNHLHGESWSREHQRQELQAELEGRNPFTDFTGEGIQ